MSEGHKSPENSDSVVAFEAAIQKIDETLTDMRHGALEGCNPTWAAHMAFTLVEARNAIYSGLSASEVQIAMVDPMIDVEEIYKRFGAKPQASD